MIHEMRVGGKGRRREEKRGEERKEAYWYLGSICTLGRAPRPHSKTQNIQL